MTSPRPLLPALVRTEVVKGAMVLGNGLSAAVISLELAAQQYDVNLLMTGNELSNLSTYAFPDARSRDAAAAKMKSISTSPRIRLHQGCVLSSIKGWAGDFQVNFAESNGNGNERAGVIILAQDPALAVGEPGGSVLSNTEMREMIEACVAIPDIVVFIEGSGATLSCPARGTAASIENALAIKKIRPEAQVYVLARDVAALGAFERTYHSAQEEGIVFFRGDSSYRWSEGKPDGLIIRDPVVGEVRILPDIVVRDEAFDIGSNSILGRKLGLSLSREDQVLGLSTRLHPGETIREGVFLCQGLAASTLASDNISEACAVASSASEMLSKEFLEHGAEAAYVDEEKCSACLACVRICPYDAPFIGDKGKAEIRVSSCQGCGMCVSLCPSKAIDQRNWTDAQLSAKVAIAPKEAGG